MSKLYASLVLALAATPMSAGAAALGPHAAACAPGAGGPAMLIRVQGLKSRAGSIRVQTYGGDPARYFDKGAYLERVDVPTPRAGPVEICMPVPQPGTYAVSVRHTLGSELENGGGMSGNPDISFMDVLLKRRPSPVQVQVHVRGIVPVPIVMNYVSGTSVGPLKRGASEE